MYKASSNDRFFDPRTRFSGEKKRSDRRYDQKRQRINADERKRCRKNQIRMDCSSQEQDYQVQREETEVKRNRSNKRWLKTIEKDTEIFLEIKIVRPKNKITK